MKTASRIYRGAAIYGILALVPMFFLEARFGQDYPPPLTHAEFYYGFNALALVWQFAFLVIATDPVRYRPLMIVTVFEKLSWGAIAFGSAAIGRDIPPATLGFATMDLVLGALFIYAWTTTGRSAQEAGRWMQR